MRQRGRDEKVWGRKMKREKERVSERERESEWERESEKERGKRGGERDTWYTIVAINVCQLFFHKNSV